MSGPPKSVTTGHLAEALRYMVMCDGHVADAMGIRTRGYEKHFSPNEHEVSTAYKKAKMLKNEGVFCFLYFYHVYKC